MQKLDSDSPQTNIFLALNESLVKIMTPFPKINSSTQKCACSHKNLLTSQTMLEVINL
jgi:hypothetical protein